MPRRILMLVTLVLALACLDNEKGTAPPAGVTVAAIGASGGELATTDARVIIPAAALQETITFSMREVTQGLPPEHVGSAIELTPEGTGFARPVTIELAFSSSRLPDPDHPELVAVAVVESGAWVDLPDGAVDVAAGKVRGTTTHFSTFGVVQRCNERHPCPDGEHCVDRRCAPDAEDCGNRHDDDGDGGVDCQDPDCHASDHCTCTSEGTLTCCYAKCGEHEQLQCLGENICGYPCSCVAVTGEVCDNGADDDGDGLIDCHDQDCAHNPVCPVQGDARWYYTCGDPVCHGHSGSDDPVCTHEVVGEPCQHIGARCDPVDDCNRRVVCASEDPTHQPGGCPISRRALKQDVRYLDDVELGRYAEQALSVRLATWRYTFAPDKQRLGFILDDDPESPAVDPVRDIVDVYGFTSLTLAALQVQAREIDELRMRLEALERQCAEPPR